MSRAQRVTQSNTKLILFNALSGQQASGNYAGCQVHGYAPQQIHAETPK